MKYYLPHDDLNHLITHLKSNGYRCMGPTVKDGAIVFDELSEAKQLPWGIRDEQLPGKYRLHQTNNKEAFAWANGPQAIKPMLFAPKESLWKVERDEQGKMQFKEITQELNPIALIGARSCDLAAMAIQDKVFIHDQFTDKRYQTRREQLLIIAVNCGYSGGNCFCVSTQTGPKATSGYDLAMTEIEGGFVIEVGTVKGKAIIKAINCVEAKTAQQQAAKQATDRACQQQSKVMPKQNSRGLRDVLMNNLDHPRWDDVASRCLSCGNCTSVCPTCFCHHESETPEIDSSESVHAREWDSCFTQGHSYIHNQVIRDDTKSRYKQWLTHKLGTWWDQFDTSGCIGCGRCITWCPVGIDITEEMAAISGESNLKTKQDKS